MPHGAFARHRPTTLLGYLRRDEDTAMLDILLLSLGVGVFALLAAYAVGCEKV
ncbi:hypothetical protein AAFN86_25680 [Roseomonas sp. CAU 1739]|uniref:hypothetical protein n=1 Tax=Roseomonas sp. CAU 1739 TaxID=3140364 RepID=UPI00325BA516